MDTRSVTPERLAASVLAVPPLARDDSLQIAAAENRKMIEFLEQGGVSTLLYGGNAVLYHVRPSEYAAVLQMLVEAAADETLVIPSVGPAFGTMLDQADVLSDFDFPTVMILPQRDVVDAEGIVAGIHRFVDRFGKPVVLYLKHDRWLPAETVGKLHRGGLLSWIKYAVVREDPAEDDYLREVLTEVPANIMVSGIGEQPAIVHMQDFELTGFTSGCVCLNPARSMEMLRAIQAGQIEKASALKQQFAKLEDLRNAINPIRVLHRAVELAGVATMGPISPLLGELTAEQSQAVGLAAMELRKS